MSGVASPINQLLDTPAIAPQAPALNALLPVTIPAQPAPAQAADPYDYTDKFNTQLSPPEESAYQAWGRDQAAQHGRNPAADTYDYDMRGFWKSGGDFAANGHGGDQFKKPNHPTFSNLSQYQGPSGNIPGNGPQGGAWGGGQNGQPWTFTPSATNLLTHDAADLQRYFQQVEQGNRLILPEGSTP
jgi:hypothetical protein